VGIFTFTVEWPDLVGATLSGEELRGDPLVPYTKSEDALAPNVQSFIAKHWYRHIRGELQRFR
jgi:hypothetical protein